MAQKNLTDNSSNNTSPAAQQGESSTASRTQQPTSATIAARARQAARAIDPATGLPGVIATYTTEQLTPYVEHLNQTARNWQGPGVLRLPQGPQQHFRHTIEDINDNINADGTPVDIFAEYDDTDAQLSNYGSAQAGLDSLQREDYTPAAEAIGQDTPGIASETEVWGLEVQTPASSLLDQDQPTNFSGHVTTQPQSNFARPRLPAMAPVNRITQRSSLRGSRSQPDMRTEEGTTAREAPSPLILSPPTLEMPSNMSMGKTFGGMQLSDIPKLEQSTQWTEWDRATNAFLVMSGSFHIVNMPEPQEPNQKRIWATQQEMIAIAILQRIGTAGYNSVHKIRPVKRLKEAIDDFYKPKGSGTFGELYNKIHDTRLESFNNTTEYIEALEMLNHSLELIHPECALTQCQLIMLMLRNLTDEYDIFRTSWSTTHNIVPGESNVARIDEVKMAIIRQETEHKPTYTAMLSHRPVKGKKWCDHCKTDTHVTQNCWTKDPSKRPQNRFGQRNKDRPDSKRTSRSPTKRRRNRSPSSSEEDDSEKGPNTVTLGKARAMMAKVGNIDLYHYWVIDSGASHHIATDRGSFTNYRRIPGSYGNVEGMGKTTVTPVGIGTVTIKCMVNNKPGEVKMHDVLHCPDAMVNLMSVHSAIEGGGRLTFEKDKACLHIGKKMISGTEFGKIYLLDTLLGPDNVKLKRAMKQDTALIAYGISNDPVLALWHERLGHLSEQNVKRLEDMSTGMDLSRPPPSMHLCHACVVAKLKECAHKRKNTPGRHPLDLIHSDVAGPLVPDYCGNRYWVTWLDDFTKASWVDFVKSKSEVHQSFIRFRKRNESIGAGHTIRRLRTDQGGEYISTEFQKMLYDSGIDWEHTATDQPEQNGAAERLNQTLVKRAAPNLLAGSVNLKYWSELIASANYLRWRSPATGLDKTPYEAWFGHQPDLHHLRIIGSRGWMKNHKTKSKKLVDKTVPCQLLGYTGNTMYRVLLQDGRVVRANNVAFEESRIIPRETVLVQPSKHTSRNSEGEKVVRNTSEPQESPTKRNRTNRDRTGSPVSLTEATRALTIREASEEVHDSITLDTTPRAFAAIINGAVQPNTQDEPTHAEAMKGSDKEKWQEAMMDEYKSLTKNNTWTVTSLPPDRTALTGKWVLKIKRGPKGEILRYKARWVVRGFEQIEGVDFNETFASVIKPMSYKMLFAIVAAHDLELEQMDVKTAFLYGNVDEEIYVVLPPGIDDDSVQPGQVCRLNKALYGLKQAPRVWYETIKKAMGELSLHPLISDTSIFADGKGLTVGIYVDDMLIAGNDKNTIQALKGELTSRFEMSDLGPVAYYLGMTVSRDRKSRTISLGQEAYVNKVLTSLELTDMKTCTTPMELRQLSEPPEEYSADPAMTKRYQRLVGSLMYAMLCTRPDIAYAVSAVSRWAANPTEEHWKAAKRVLRYLKGTRTWQIRYQGAGRLEGYTDSDWAGSVGRKSVSGYCFSIGEGVISWQSKRQANVTLSSTEAEYVGESFAAREAIWLARLYKELLPGEQASETKRPLIHADNQGAITLASNEGHHNRTKHIDVVYHFVRDEVLKGNIEVQYVPTGDNTADGFTKPLGPTLFAQFRQRLGLVDIGDEAKAGKMMHCEGEP